MINGTLYYFGPYDYIFDENTDFFIQRENDKEIQNPNFVLHSNYGKKLFVIHTKSGQNIMFWKSTPAKESSIWNKINVPFQHSLAISAIVMSEDGKYMIIIGGSIQVSWFSTKIVHDIYYLNTKTLDIKKSKIKIPNIGNNISWSRFDAVMPGHASSDKLTVEGYARAVWKGKGSENMRYPPSYLLQIIECYYKDEMVYLFYGFQ